MADTYELGRCDRVPTGQVMRTSGTEVGAGCATSLLGWPLEAWAFMIGVGVTHEWIPAVPTIGYVDALFVALGLSAVGGLVFGHRR